MIREIEIKNYRGFRDFKMSGLERVNLITGANNVGKTSLLEAIYLNLEPTSVDEPTPMKLLRGFETFSSKLELEDTWGWLFYKRNFEAPITIQLVTDYDKQRTLEIQYSSRIPAVTLQVTSDLHKTRTVRRIGMDDSSIIPPPPATFNGKPIKLRVILEKRYTSFEEDAQLFSKIDDAGRKEEILKPLSFLDNRLRDLVVSVASGMPMINCDIGIGQRIPLPQMGEGMVHFFSVISEIVYAAGGVVLIDEVETGLHYSTMVQVWKAIAEAAQNSNTQIFATTHSFECISAAHKAFAERDKYDLRLHRLDRVNEEIKAFTYDKEMLEAALLTDLEVR